MKLYKIITALLLSSICILSCTSNDEEEKTFSNLLNTLKSGSGIIGEVYSESINSLREGVTVFDIDFESEGERTHMFVAQVDLNKVTIVASTPNDKPELANPDAILPVHAGAAEGNGKTVWVGVNGDYWAETSSVPGGLVPMGIFYKDGVAIRTTYYDQHTEVIYKKKDGSVGIGTATDIFPYLDDMQEVIGGRGLLIKDNVQQTLSDEITQSTTRYPRTGVGLNNNTKTLYFIVVDGRQQGYSSGLDLNALASLFHALNCTDAIALDGGGSSTMVVRKVKPDGLVTFPIVNKPSDTDGARTISNGILVIDNLQ